MARVVERLIGRTQADGNLRTFSEDLVEALRSQHTI